MTRPSNLQSLNQLLSQAEKGGYAVGAFSPRYTPVIRAVLRAGEKLRSPLIIQIAQVEFDWYQYSLRDFARSFWTQLIEEKITVPVGLHLDHTQNYELIEEAVDNGFSSVMIDASAKSLQENIAITKKVVQLAHRSGVSVEAELGRIGTGDSIESGTDEELFTNPEEARIFVEETGVDALAVSVGTAHGIYKVVKPRIDLERIQAIHALTPVHLVLHGGSGTPADLIYKAIHLPGGGVSKINVATDLEMGLLSALGRKEPLTNIGLIALPESVLKRGLMAVQSVVEDKMIHFLESDGHA